MLCEDPYAVFMADNPDYDAEAEMDLDMTMKVVDIVQQIKIDPEDLIEEDTTNTDGGEEGSDDGEITDGDEDADDDFIDDIEDLVEDLMDGEVEDDLMMYLIIGLAGLAFVILLVILIVCCCARGKNNSQANQSQENTQNAQGSTNQQPDEEQKPQARVDDPQRAGESSLDVGGRATNTPLKDTSKKNDSFSPAPFNQAKEQE